MARVFYDLSDCLSNDTSEFEFNKHEITYLTPELTAAQSAEWGLGPDVLARRRRALGRARHALDPLGNPRRRSPPLRPRRDRARRGRSTRYRSSGATAPASGSTSWRRPDAGITRETSRPRSTRPATSSQPLDIVLVWTGTDLKQPGYESRHPGLRRDATEYLVDRGVKLIGIDAWGIDRPFDVMIEDAKAGRAQFWESHLLGREKEYCQIERLANLETLPRTTGFTVSAFPFKIERASAAWARVVAIFDA